MTTPAYVAPRLEKFGTFRQVTQASRTLGSKSIIGTDAVIPGLDCDPNDTGCVRS